MLTETVPDPRRANWLTLSSMSEDFCWPEDQHGTSRPSWELEAEILRLTTRLMMRERELKQAKAQLKTQATRTQQQLATWRRKMDEKEEQLRRLLLQKDSEMEAIVSQLLLFEAELRQEQKRIETLLSDKDATILKQQEEIRRLQKTLDQEVSNKSTKTEVQVSLDSPLMTSCDSDSNLAVKKLKDGLIRIRAIQDLTNVRSKQDITSVGDIFAEKKRTTNKTPQKVKDLKAKRINSYKMQRQIGGDFFPQVAL